MGLKYIDAYNSCGSKEERLVYVPAVQTLVEVDGVLPGHHLFLSPFRLVHHFRPLLS